MNYEDEIILNKMVEVVDEYYRTKAARMDALYLDIAERVSQMSFAKRRKVGAVVVKDNNILSFGWNGMPSGFNNICEVDDTSDPRVIHAEINAFAKLSRSTGHSEGATLYLTLSPCYDCAKMIIQSGIKRVVFRDLYRVADAIPFLEEAGVIVEQIEG
jgi:dCMP deaminase